MHVGHQAGTPQGAPTKGGLSLPTGVCWCVRDVSVGSCCLQRCYCERSLLAAPGRSHPTWWMVDLLSPATGMCSFWFSTTHCSMQTFCENCNGTNYCFSFPVTCSWSGLCLSGKLPELRLVGVSFNFKVTLSLYTMLPSHVAFPIPLPDSPPPKTFTSFLASYGAWQTVLPGVLCPFSVHSSSCPPTEGLNRLLFDWKNLAP